MDKRVDPLPRKRPKDVRVTVLGGGIAGLTAAHELITRGFEVEVIERSVGQRPEGAVPMNGPPIPSMVPRGSASRAQVAVPERPVANLPSVSATPFQRPEDDRGRIREDVDVGGMARSQWSTPPYKDTEAEEAHRAAGHKRDRTARSLSGPGIYPLLNDQGEFVYEEIRHRYVAVRFRGAEMVATETGSLAAWIKEHPLIQLVALSYEDRRREALDGERDDEPLFGTRAAIERANQVAEVISGALTEAGITTWMPPTIATLPIGADEWEKAVASQQGEGEDAGFVFPGVLLRAHEDTTVLPGEHGFRFFPGFYWHLRDTMARTPIYEFPDAEQGQPPPKPIRTHRPVLENLEEVEWQIIADPTRMMPTAFRRTKPSSIQEFLEQWQTLRNDLGFRDTDMLRFILRLGRYATSSRSRREGQYAHISWWDFLSLKRLDELPIHPSTRRMGADGPPRQGFAGRTRPSRRRGEGQGGRDPRAPYGEADDFRRDDNALWDTETKGKEAYREFEEAFRKLLKQDRGRRDREESSDFEDGLPLGAHDRLPYGLRFRRLLRHSPRALVAMDAPVTDAHTQGLLSTQLAIDQLGLNPRTDSTLNGPTSEAWFRHWKAYLAEQGVTFVAGEVTRIDVASGSYAYVDVQSGDEVPVEQGTVGELLRYTICALDPTSLAKVLVSPAPKKKDAAEKGAITGLKEQFSSRWDAIGKLLGEVSSAEPGDPSSIELDEARKRFAVPGEQVWCSTMLEDPDACHFVRRFRDWAYDVRTATAETPGWTDPQRIAAEDDVYPLDARFQVLAGLQLYFDRPTAFEHGHIYFAESPWGLMAMSQLQHWETWNSRPLDVWGNLSVVIGSWRRQGRTIGDFAIRRLVAGAQEAHPLHAYSALEVRDGKVSLCKKRVPEEREGWAQSPSRHSADEIADGTRAQVAWCRGTDTQFRADLHVPPIKIHHLDDYLHFRGGEAGKAAWNRCPYLINLSGDWDNRPPGEPWNPNRRDTRLVPSRDERGYRVYGAEIPLVFAGMHARTFTRMATMEASNESARHAVNSVLCHLSMREEVQQFIELAGKPPPPAEDGPSKNELPAQLLGSASILESNQLRDGSARGGGPAHGRPSPRQRDLPILEPTWYGDLCEVRDPDDYEIPSLEFFRTVDEELFQAQAPREDGPEDGNVAYPADGVRVRRKHDTRRVPHLFDLLQLDALPDRIESGDIPFDETLRTLHGVFGGMLKSLRGPDPMKAVLNLVDSLDGMLRSKKT